MFLTEHALHCVFTFCKRLSLLLEKLRTFALSKLPVFVMGNFIKMNSSTYLKFLIGVLTELCLYITNDKSLIYELLKCQFHLP